MGDHCHLKSEAPQATLVFYFQFQGLAAKFFTEKSSKKKSKDIYFLSDHLHVKFQSCQIPSASNLLIRPASTVCQRIPTPILSCFKVLDSQVLQGNTIFAFLVNWFQFNYTLIIAFTTNNHSFVYLVDFVQFLLGTNLSVVRLKIYPLRPKSVKSWQTICACKMLVMTENLSK